ncbi:MAG: class I SAM-dependent methyltransferase [Deltaproteobacteria bacterium]|nr:class I SAM-dependent methyltransferase [Deltaproteobacteria bacterium]
MTLSATAGANAKPLELEPPAVIGAPAGTADSGWEHTACAVCETQSAEAVLVLPHSDAPRGWTAIVRCTRCGLQRLDPRPGAAMINRYYEDDYGAYAGRRRGRVKQALWELLRDVSSTAPGWGEHLRPLRPLARRLAAAVFDINVPLEGAQPLRVLDVGCGYGDVLRYLQSRGCLVQGVDFDPRAAAHGLQHGTPIHIGRMQDLGLPPDSVDVAILCHSLEHLPEPAQTVAALSRVVKPGGRVHIAVPNGRAVGLQQEGEGWGALFLPIHFWFFDAAALTALLGKHGFRVASVGYATLWRNHWQLWRSRVRGSGRAAVALQAWRFCLRSLCDREGGDVVRVTAVKLVSAAGGVCAV